MFRILELSDLASAQARDIGQRYATHEEALIAMRKHLKRFSVSGHNPEANYWWARDSDGLKKCWIAIVE